MTELSVGVLHMLSTVCNILVYAFWFLDDMLQQQSATMWRQPHCAAVSHLLCSVFCFVCCWEVTRKLCILPRQPQCQHQLSKHRGTVPAQYQPMVVAADISVHSEQIRCTRPGRGAGLVVSLQCMHVLYACVRSWIGEQATDGALLTLPLSAARGVCRKQAQSAAAVEITMLFDTLQIP